MSGFSVRLTHRIMAIGVIGLAGLLTVGAIYEVGNRSQDASRATAMHARAIADLDKQLSIEMLEARRNEKNFRRGATNPMPRPMPNSSLSSTAISIALPR